MASNYSRNRLHFGTENFCYFGTERPQTLHGQFYSCRDKWDAFNQARLAARTFAGMLNATSVPFVQELGPWKGWVTGSQTPDGLRGWRLDFDTRGDKGFHVNWWDRSQDRGGRNRSRRLFGANVIVGEGLDMFWEVLSHFPGQVERTP